MNTLSLRVNWGYCHITKHYSEQQSLSYTSFKLFQESISTCITYSFAKKQHSEVFLLHIQRCFDEHEYEIWMTEAYFFSSLFKINQLHVWFILGRQISLTQNNSLCLCLNWQTPAQNLCFYEMQEIDYILGRRDPTELK